MIAPERAGAKRHLDVQTTAEALLAHIKRNGTQYFFVNAGTDFASVVEAYARLDESGLDFPTPIVATHENLAVGMAHGYYLIARTPQAVMCHVSVGLGQRDLRDHERVARSDPDHLHVGPHAAVRIRPLRQP